MRKLMLLTMLLLLCILPALAEETAARDALAGEWIPYYIIKDGHLFATNSDGAGRLIIADGQLTSNQPDSPSFPLEYDRDAGKWSVSDPTSDTMITLTVDPLGQLIMHDGQTLLLTRRPDAAPAELPPRSACLATAGTWQATTLYIPDNWNGIGSPAFTLYFDSLGIPAVTMSLPAFCSYTTLRDTYADAVRLLFPVQVPDLLSSIQGYEVWNDDTLLFSTRWGRIIFKRISAPEVDAALLPHAQAMANSWRMSELRIGGIPMPALEGNDFAIDEQGNVLYDNELLPLHLEGDTLMLEDCPVRMEDGRLIVSLSGGVEAHYITEADWHRAALNGVWQLNTVDVSFIDYSRHAADVQLIIQPDGLVVLRYPQGEITFTITPTFDSTVYQLTGADTRCLMITGYDPLMIIITDEAESYTMHFSLAE